MRKFYLLLVLVICFIGKQTYSQFTPVQWKKLYDTASIRLVENFPIHFFGGSKLVKLSNGEALFAADFNGDIGLWKVDANGNLIWRKTFGGSGTDNVNAIRQARDGGFVIVGKTTSNDGLFTGLKGFNDGFVAKTDQGGNLQWVRLIGGQGMDAFTNIEVVGDGYVAVGNTEFVDDPIFHRGIDDVLVTHINWDGTVAWTKTFSGSNCVRVFTLLINKNEDIIIGGLFTSPGCNLGGSIRKLLIGLNKDGVKLWQNENITGDLGSITNLAFNADSSQMYSIVKKMINEQPWLYKFNSVTGEVISTKQLNINISTDFGATAIRRKSNNNYWVPIASPVYRTSSLEPKLTYLAEMNDTGKVISLNQFDFNGGMITDLVERNNDYLLLSSKSFLEQDPQVYLAAYSPNPTVPDSNTIITSFHPLNGVKYNVITIKGRSFTGATAVSFGGVPAYSFSVLNDTVISAIVNTGATGQVSVSSPRGTAVKDGFTFIVRANAPTITSFSPATGGFLHTVVIKGTNFIGVREVIFGGYYAYSYEVINDSTISAKVGRGGADDKVSVHTNWGSAFMGGFTYLQPLPVSGFSPAYGTVGTTVRITGSQFSDTLTKNHVYFGQAEATVLEASTTSLLVKVPSGATSAQIIVTVGTTSGYTRDVFMVIQPGDEAARTFAFDTSPQLAGSSNAIRSFAAGDFDGDGITDLAVVAKGSTILSVFKSTSHLDSISFKPAITFTLPGNAMDVLSGDIDVDGKTDILVKTNQQGYISLFRNTSVSGSISFASRVDIEASTYPNNQDHGNLLALVDMNGDGKPEIITDNVGDRTFSILRNTGGPGVIQFAPKLDFPYYPFGFVVRDFNGDNKPDIVMLSNGNFFVVFKNTSEGGNISLVQTPGVSTPYGRIIGITANDFDGDGKQDIAGIVTERNLTIFRNISITDSIAFTPKSDWGLAFFPSYINSGDFDSDGKVDIVVGNNSQTTFSLFRNISTPGNLALTFKQDFSTGTNAAQSVVADINNDGKPDIATIAEEDGRVFIARNRLHEPLIQSFSPAYAAKGDTITLKGENFTGVTSVKFDNVNATSFALQNDSTITAVVDTGATGVVSVMNSYGRGSKAGFYFGVKPVVDSCLPLKGGPGTIVTIKGKNFTTATGVRFGNVSAASFSFINDSTVRAIVDTGSTGDVIITTQFGSDSLAGFEFGYIPVIQSFVPTYGKKGDTIIVKGKYLMNNVTSVKFGGIAAASYVMESDSILKAIVDTGATGTVELFNDFGAGRKAGFIFGNPPSITSFSPEKASKGASILIRGQNLMNITSIAFGGTLASSFTPFNDSIVLAVVDTGSTGSVTVTTLFGSDTLTGFTFGPVPVITSFTPMHGLTGDTIAITGKHLMSSRIIRFGGVPAASFVIVNDSTVKAVVGKGASGAILIYNEFSTVEVNGFIFDHSPTITSFSPLTGPVGTTVTIKGANFNSSLNGNTVYFGATRATFLSATDSVLTVTVPAGATYKPITVTNGDSLMAFSNERFVLTFPGAADSLIAEAAFAERIAIAAGTGIYDLAQGDLDGDGKIDLVAVLSSSKVVRVYRNTSANGIISFTTSDYPVYNPKVVTIGDVNADGKLDIIVNQNIGNTIYVLVNSSTGAGLSFKGGNAFGGGDNVAAVRDLDMDGRADVLVLPVNGFNVAVYKNVSFGGMVTFARTLAIKTALLKTRTAIIEDINRDGKPDVCLEAANGTRDSLYVFINTSQPGMISFAPKQAFSKGINGAYQMAGGDLDGDHSSELVISSSVNTSGTISILSNSGTNGTLDFGTPLQLNAGNNPKSIALGDINGDGKPEIALSNSDSNTVSFIANRSTPGGLLFAGRTSLASGTYPRGINLGDLDGDGKPDLALFNEGVDSISIFRNKIGEALVIPSGTNPVTGGMTNKVTIDPTVQTHNGKAYVQRHYDITPVNNPATATATLTLYFTQQEFDNYNAHPAHGLDLPHHATDNLNKANLRVYQYHGFSTTGQPGSYSGNGVEIDPDDLKIVWNATTLQWEVTFDVNGFSGFFLGSAGSSILPVTILSFTGKVRDQKTLLEWTTTSEINVAHFELQRRDNNGDFVTIARIKPASSGALEYNYQYTDALGEATIYHYRLKIVDIDQSATYSKIITIKPASDNASLALQPNPARDFVMVKHPANNGTAQIRIVDMFGKTLKAVPVARHATQTRLELKGLPKGTYTIVLEDGTHSTSQVLIIQ
jgi:predicted aspartyl protease